MKTIGRIAGLLLCVGLTGCARPVPDHLDNICKIFRQYPDWYANAHESERRWGTPVSVQMAIIHQESHFDATARPPRTRLLGVIPWMRPTTAYGYSQALNGTWRGYKSTTGRYFASRDAFSDAIDFVGWFSREAHRQARIHPKNAYDLYLAYHEGIGGYSRRSYLAKPWLVRVARKVQRIASVYDGQLAQCQGNLQQQSWNSHSIF